MQKVISIIQDKPAEAAAARLALAAAGYTVRVAPDAAEFALQMQREGKPDLVVAALRLPFMDGMHIARALKACAALSHIPVVLIHAGRNTRNLAAAYAAGCVAVLPDVLRPDMLAALLAGACDARLAA